MEQLLRSKQALAWFLVLGFVGALLYLQLRTWREFDWRTFFVQTTSGMHWLNISVAIALVFLGYWLRAVRWKVFLRPVKKTASWSLFPPTLVGFTSLALFGRPGELARPYLTARRERLSMASQVGVWTVERVFDLASFALIAAIEICRGAMPGGVNRYRMAGVLFVAGTVALGLAVVLIWYKGEAVVFLVERSLRSRPHVARRLVDKLRAFHDGLNTIADGWSFFEVAALSLALWYSLALVHLEILRAYPALASLGFSSAVVLVGFSIVGGLVQLPAVGGGAQIATILALVHVFGVPRELAVSCGILLWLVTFQAVIPVGLAIARREHVSIRRIESAVEQRAAPTSEAAAREDFAA